MAVPARTGPKVRVTYSARVAEEICRRIAEGEPLHRVCETAGMPTVRAVHKWVQRDESGFRAMFTSACEARALIWAEQLLEIADGATAETWPVVKVQLDTRKWLAAKFYAKVFGDRIVAQTQQLDAAGNPTDPARITVIQAAIGVLSTGELRTLRALMEKCGIRADGDIAPRLPVPNGGVTLSEDGAE